MGLSRALDRADDQMVIGIENAPRMGGTTRVAHVAHSVLVLMFAMRANPVPKLRDVGVHGRTRDRRNRFDDGRKFGEDRASLGKFQRATAIGSGLGWNKSATHFANILADGLAVFRQGNSGRHACLPYFGTFRGRIVATRSQQNRCVGNSHATRCKCSSKGEYQLHFTDLWNFGWQRFTVES